MYHLATVFPFLRNIRIPLTRDQIMLLMVAVNEVFLGLEHYFAHLISGTIRPWEALPIIFGPITGIVLIIAGAISLKWRTLASTIATIVLTGSILIGVIGWYLHFIRAAIPGGPMGEQISIKLLVWAPPILGPLTASMIGLVGIVAAWREVPVDSGVLVVTNRLRLQFPYTKTSGWAILVGLGILATTISSVFDHARTGFVDYWVWIPAGVGIFGTTVAVTVGSLSRPSRGDLTVYVIAMVLLIAVGVIGALLHVLEDLTALNAIVPERFIRGAPFLAPLLFSDMGAFGLIILLDPREGKG